MNNAITVTEPGSHGEPAAAGRQYPAFPAEWETQPTAGSASGASGTPVFLVVGYDGTGPGKRALDCAATLLHDRDGALEVVYVAHVPAGATLSADATAEMRNGFDDLEAHFAGDVRSRLGATETRWHFQRRDGAVAHELMVVADELRGQHGPQSRIAIIVGGSAHKYHRVVGSVSMNLERADRFPVMEVP